MRIARLFLSTGLLLLAIGVAPATVCAQTGAATLTGIVSDQSGAPVPGTTVTATKQDTNVAYTTVSNEAGNYTLTSLSLGTYVVKAELSGFKTTVTKPIQVEAKQIMRLDFKLDLGSIQESIEVTARLSVLQTESATVGTVISGTTVNALPLNGRNTGQLALLQPGAVTPNPSAFTAIRNFSGGRPYVNGNREQTNNFTIDGVDMNESIDNLVAYQPSPDALSQISVETNNYAADTGNVAGAVISNVIKSGSNKFKGNLFEFYRNSVLDANSWSNNRSSAPKPKRRQDIYGGTLGGPLAANKLFFFADYQGTRFDAPGSELISVAPASWRGGDDSRTAGGRARRLERLVERQDLRTLLARRVRVAQQQARLAAALGQPDDGAVPQPGGQLEPRVQFLPGQRGARRLQPDHHRLAHPRLGGNWQRQRELRDRGRPTDPRPQLDRLGQRAERGGRRRERH